jgi:peptide/nickel transport system substrate-binding protein
MPRLAQLRYLPRLLGPKARLLMWAATLVFVVSSVVFGGRWYYRATEVVPQKGGSFTEGVVGLPQYVNPILSPLSDVDSDIAELLFSSMFKYDDQQQLQSDLVTNYVISDDQLTYTFFLRSNAKWHDGDPLTADDVLFTIFAIQDPLYQSPLYASLQGVQATKLDDSSFSLTLSEPYAPFLSTLTFGILPEHLWYNVPPQNIALTELNIKPIGSGAYKFESLTKDKTGTIKSFHVVRADDFYGDEPYLDDVTFVFYPDIATAIQALEGKKIEGLSFIPQDAKEEIQKKNGGVQFHALRIPQYTAIFFNQKRSEVLQDADVRTALVHAVDRQAMIDSVLGGQGEAIYTPILPGYVGHNAEVEKHEFDLNESIRLLEDGGWKFPEGVTAEQEITEEKPFTPREKDGRKLEFTIATVDIPEYQNTLALLQQRWQEIGVKVNVDVYGPSDIQQQIIKTRKYEALLFGEIVGTDPDPYPFWHSSQQEHPGLALSIFRDREIDDLLEEARKTNNEEERRKKYLHFQNNLANDLPAIFLYNSLYTYAIHDKIEGVNSQQYITVPSDRFSGIAHWYVKTERKLKD